MAVLVEDRADADVPRPRRRWPLAVIGLLVVALAAWLVVAHQPSVQQGSFGNVGDLRAADDGISTRRYVVDDPSVPSVLVVSIRNGGRIPYEVVGLDPEVSDPHVLGVSFEADPFESEQGVGSPDAPTVDRVTLRPGDEAAVHVELGVDPCVSMAGGTYADISSLPLLVRQLGVTSTQELPLPLPVTILGPVAADGSAGCL